MAKKRKVVEVAKRVVEPAVKVVHRTRAKLSRGGSRMSGGEIAAALGGAMAGGVVSHGLTRVGASQTIASLGVAGVGGVGAVLLDGKAQAASVGAAASGLVLAATAMIVDHPRAVAQPPAPPRVAPPPRQAALPPADVQAAFDAARAQLRQRADWGYWDRYGVSQAA